MSGNRSVATVKKKLSGDTDAIELQRARANVTTKIDIDNEDVSYGSSVTTAATFTNNMSTIRGQCYIEVHSDYDGLGNVILTKGVNNNGMSILKLYKVAYDINLGNYNNKSLFLNDFTVIDENKVPRRYSITGNVNNIDNSIISSFTDNMGNILVDGLGYDSHYNGLSTFRENDNTFVNLEIMDEQRNVQTIHVPIVKLFDPVKGEIIHNPIDDLDFVVTTGL